jgi:hypothetical protein
VAAIVHESQSTDLLWRQVARNVNWTLSHPGVSPGGAAEVANDNHAVGVNDDGLPPPVFLD